MTINSLKFTFHRITPFYSFETKQLFTFENKQTSSSRTAPPFSKPLVADKTTHVCPT